MYVIFLSAVLTFSFIAHNSFVQKKVYFPLIYMKHFRFYFIFYFFSNGHIIDILAWSCSVQPHALRESGVNAFAQGQAVKAEKRNIHILTTRWRPPRRSLVTKYQRWNLGIELTRCFILDVPVHIVNSF